jgi:hypothetical protein
MIACAKWLGRTSERCTRKPFGCICEGKEKMRIETAYAINDVVVPISVLSKETWVECPACGGTGKVTLRDGEHPCPKCYGNRGSKQYCDHCWQITSPITIGQVRAVLTNLKKTGMFDNVGEYADGSDELEVSYMAYETGVGSGSVYYERNLFRSNADAQAECDMRNAEEATA